MLFILFSALGMLATFLSFCFVLHFLILILIVTSIFFWDHLWKILYNFRVIYFNENGAPFIGENTTNHLLNLRSDIRKNKQLLKNRITIKGNIIYFNTPPQVGA